MINYPYKRIVCLDDKLLKAIDDYGYNHHVPSAMETVRRLIRHGLLRVAELDAKAAKP
jgi:hypothetical protein